MRTRKERFESGFAEKKRKKKMMRCESFFSLTISDNGKGIPGDIDLENLETLGPQLVSILVDQLDEEIETKRENGMEFRITFSAAERL
jgi:two-component sensor histidine kinase